MYCVHFKHKSRVKHNTEKNNNIKLLRAELKNIDKMSDEINTFINIHYLYKQFKIKHHLDPFSID